MLYKIKNKEITKEEIEESNEKLNNWYKEKKIKEGDYVLLDLEDEEYIIKYTIGNYENGVVSIPIDYRSPKEYKAFIKKITNPKLIINEENKKEYEKQTRNKEERKKEGPCTILFTSGSTNNPKAIKQTFKNIEVHYETLKKVFEAKEGTKILNTMALHYSDGINQGILFSYINKCILFRKEFKISKIKEWSEFIKKENIEIIVTTPTMIKIINKFKEIIEEDLKKVKTIISTSDKLEKEDWEEFEEYFGEKIISVYGLTESTAGSLFTEKGNKEHRGTMGVPIDCEVKIIKEELLIKGKHIMEGYLKDKKETRKILKDGWLHTGDIVKEEQGVFSIKGRSRNIIVTAGYTIYPEEVNEQIKKIRGIKDSAVIGIKDSFKGEKIIAIIVKEDKDINIGKLLKENLVKYKVPEKIFFVESIEKTITGKINYKKLKDFYERKNI